MLSRSFSSQPIDAGEMAEWLKAHAWKAIPELLDTRKIKPLQMRRLRAFDFGAES